jgi:hypothetical protein
MRSTRRHAVYPKNQSKLCRNTAMHAIGGETSAYGVEAVFVETMGRMVRHIYA